MEKMCFEPGVEERRGNRGWQWWWRKWRTDMCVIRWEWSSWSAGRRSSLGSWFL